MKTTHIFLITTLILAAPLAAAADADAQARSRVAVQFFEPEKFTDVRDTYMGDYSRTTYLDRLRDHLLERAKSRIPADCTLSVTFSDIDMAGDFEPWHGARWTDVRIVRDIYPPRINLTFRLTDAAGNVVSAGQRELRDLAFLMKITMAFRDDPVRHEKALLDDWLSSEFPRSRKS